jgi:hypothetical protein
VSVSDVEIKHVRLSFALNADRLSVGAHDAELKDRSIKRKTSARVCSDWVKERAFIYEVNFNCHHFYHSEKDPILLVFYLF